MHPQESKIGEKKPKMVYKENTKWGRKCPSISEITTYKWPELAS